MYCFKHQCVPMYMITQLLCWARSASSMSHDDCTPTRPCLALPGMAHARFIFDRMCHLTHDRSMVQTSSKQVLHQTLLATTLHGLTIVRHLSSMHAYTSSMPLQAPPLHLLIQRATLLLTPSTNYPTPLQVAVPHQGTGPQTHPASSARLQNPRSARPSLQSPSPLTSLSGRCPACMSAYMRPS